ncbi:MAG TPA: efflux RND transporter periplasmic adaptor subunit, partial [Candidatus Polarisedimenticolia bacterium]|nr:efflux RND transporter periplasmic adaptor subunit [Candidatus Polarisedimenticolia bacterium]
MTPGGLDRRLTTGWAGLLLVSALASCSGEPPPVRPGGADASAPVPVSTVRAGSTASGATEVPGTVEAARTADVASRIAAIVEKVTVQEGSPVRKGDRLVLLDAADLKPAVRAAEAALGAARAHRDRIRALFGKDAATRQELEQAEAQGEAAEAALAAAQAQLANTDIRAPFAGVVTKRMIEPGDLAAPGRPLISLQSDTLLRIAATVTSEQAAHLRPGLELEGLLEDGRSVRAVVSILGPASDPASRRFLLKADLAADSGARAGTFARLLVRGDDTAPLATAPRAALIERGALTGLYVVEEGRARLRWISPGEARGDLVIVRAGLAPGETIVLH